MESRPSEMSRRRFLEDRVARPRGGASVRHAEVSRSRWSVGLAVDSVGWSYHWGGGGWGWGVGAWASSLSLFDYIGSIGFALMLSSRSMLAFDRLTRRFDVSMLQEIRRGLPIRPTTAVHSAHGQGGVSGLALSRVAAPSAGARTARARAGTTSCV